MIRVLLPADAPLGELGELPTELELTHQPAADVAALVLDGDLAPQFRELLPELPALGVIQTTSAGIEWLLPHVPTGVTVCNAAGIHDDAVAEWIMLVLLAMERKLPAYLELQRREEWDRNANDVTAVGEPQAGRARSLRDSRILVVGHGSIGRALATRLDPFGVHVVGVAKHARPDARPFTALDEELPLADAVVLLIPLTPETERLVDGAFLDRMKPGALLVNASRGRHVDTEALVERLRSGRLRVALDVTDPEPLPPGHPLWSAPNVIITPHLAGTVTGWRDRAYRFVGDQLRRLAAGEPLANVRNDY